MDNEMSYHNALSLLGNQWIKMILASVNRQQRTCWQIPLSAANTIRVVCMLKKFTLMHSAFSEAIKLLSSVDSSSAHGGSLLIPVPDCAQMKATYRVWFDLEMKHRNFEEALHV